MTVIARSITALLALALLATGCGMTQVALDEKFPRPLLEPLPVNIGLYLDDDFTEYRHDEELEPHGRWSILVGPGQSAMFRHILPAMFTQVSELSSLDATGNVDAVLTVALEDFQFAVPRQTRGDFYEVWIRYQMRLLEPSGDLIAEWPLTGYGKANEKDHSMLSNRNRTVLQEAAAIALRDAGAFLAMQFTEVPEVRNWLDSHTRQLSAIPVPEDSATEAGEPL